MEHLDGEAGSRRAAPLYGSNSGITLNSQLSTGKRRVLRFERPPTLTA